MAVAVKVCGLSTPDAVDAAAAGGARYAGFVFVPPSPRYVDAGLAAALVRRLPSGIESVAVTVDADDADLARILEETHIDIVQLHGNESPERVAAVRARFGRPVIKALSVAGEPDLDLSETYRGVADILLFDARARPGDVLPGGNARSFDWSLLSGRRSAGRWMLSGGLNAGNLARAVAATGTTLVDVSSGVESSRGVKDPALITAFLAAANDL